MWRETNLFGVYISPLIVYAVAAFVLTALSRAVAVRVGVYRWVWNPPLAEAAFYLCVLGLLLAFL